MEAVDLVYLCRSLAALSGIPVRVFRGEERVCFHAPAPLPRDPMEVCRREIWALTGHVGYIITSRFHVYGVVRSGEYRLVAGPTAQILASGQALRELAFQADVPPEETTAFVEGIRQIVPMPLESLLQMLLPVNYVLNGEKLELRDVTIHQAEQAAIKRRVERRRTEKTYEQDPNPRAPHNTIRLEESLMDIVRRGDSAALRQWLASVPAVRGGILAGDALRQLKNTFIVTATLASRAAIRGGLSAEDALSLSDAYVQRVELLSSQSGILNLQYNMVLEFTEQVEKVRRGGSPTRLALDAANYVRRHLSEPIRVEEMAREFYMSRSHLSTRFHAETGMTLTDFVLNEKTEEAKRLLRYSDKSASAIGAYLGFSSHGHFCRVFKTYGGMTPNEYRKQVSG